MMRCFYFHSDNKQLTRQHFYLKLYQGTPEENEGTAEWIRGYVGNEDDPTEPLTAIYYPILHDAATKIRTGDNEDGNELVGVLAL